LICYLAFCSKRFTIQNTSQAKKFNVEYRKWIGLHSILLKTQKKQEAGSEDVEKLEQEERSRLATLACMTAEQFVLSRLVLPEIE
jgi:hypothetical protein